jgi:hypothetical protein
MFNPQSALCSLDSHLSILVLKVRCTATAFTIKMSSADRDLLTGPGQRHIWSFIREQDPFRYLPPFDTDMAMTLIY